MSRDLQDYTKEELLEYIKTLKKAKKFGLVWEDKPEQVVQDVETRLPVLEEATERAITSAPDSPTHLIIEGDNYHSLSTLNYTHAGEIDIIYIDPPYNTGSDDFIYNDRYVDKEDAFRHSKWLSFISKRLELARSLLSESGLLFISIDDNEQAHLKLLCNQIFGEDNFVASFTIDKTAQGANQSTTFKTQHEFLLMYKKGGVENINYEIQGEIDYKKFKYQDEKGYYAITNSFDSINSPLSANKNRGYTVYYNEATKDAVIRDEYDRKTNTFGDYDNELIAGGYTPIRPGIRSNVQYPWNWMASRFLSDYKQELIFQRNRKGELNIYHKNRATGITKDTTIKKFDTRRSGNQLIMEIFDKKVFDYPKSVDMLEWVLTKHMNKSATILDFFAGSGTTGHAVLRLNKQDGGNRQFILGTNNENGIAENITYKRIQRVIEGYGDTEGIPANVRYFKTEFVDKQKTNDQTRLAIIERSADLIRVRENAFEAVIDEADLKVFKGAEHLTAIVFNPDKLSEFVKRIEELEISKIVNLYVFSLSNYAYQDELPETELEITACPIPESILEVYQRIFRKRVKDV
jgi:adenine-specific DNA-methyltransferase